MYKIIFAFIIIIFLIIFLMV